MTYRNLKQAIEQLKVEVRQLELAKVKLESDYFNMASNFTFETVRRNNLEISTLNRKLDFLMKDSTLTRNLDAIMDHLNISIEKGPEFVVKEKGRSLEKL